MRLVKTPVPRCTLKKPFKNSRVVLVSQGTLDLPAKVRTFCNLGFSWAALFSWVVLRSTWHDRQISDIYLLCFANSHRAGLHVPFSFTERRQQYHGLKKVLVNEGTIQKDLGLACSQKIGKINPQWHKTQEAAFNPRYNFQKKDLSVAFPFPANHLTPSRGCLPWDGLLIWSNPLMPKASSIRSSQKR